MKQDFVAQFVALSRACIAARGIFTCAMTGGSAAQQLYPLLAAADVDWTKTRLFLSDERHVPATHADSNARVIRAALPHATLELIPTALEPDAAAKAYAAVLPDQFDVIHLGMGPDGHVASLFPGHALLAEQVLRVAALTDAPKPPPTRITFTLPTLHAARAVWFLVLGEAKRAAAREAQEDASSLLPAALAHRAARSSTWFLDF